MEKSIRHRQRKQAEDILMKKLMTEPKVIFQDPLKPDDPRALDPRHAGFPDANAGPPNEMAEAGRAYNSQLADVSARASQVAQYAALQAEIAQHASQEATSYVTL